MSNFARTLEETGPWLHWRTAAQWEIRFVMVLMELINIVSHLGTSWRFTFLKMIPGE